MVQRFTKKGQRNPRFSNTLKQHVNLQTTVNLLRKINDMKSCKHIQAQIKSEVPDICAFKSNKIGQITSQNVFRSVYHVTNTTNAHKSVQREKRFRGVSHLFFRPSGNSSPSIIGMCVCTLPFHKLQQWPNGCVTH